eukprot:12908717-Prorocentrum_lima.AAC.1
MNEFGLIQNDEVGRIREIEDFKAKIAGAELARYLNDLRTQPETVMAMLDEDEDNSMIGRVRQWLCVRRPQARD